MTARASAEQSEARRPWLQEIIAMEALKVRNIIVFYSALSELHPHYALHQGRRASLRSALAPGYHISRLWRSAE